MRPSYIAITEKGHAALCGRCNAAPRAQSSRWCRECKAIYMRAWRLSKATARVAEFNQGLESAMQEVSAAARAAELDGALVTAQRMWNVNRALIAKRRRVPRRCSP